MIFTISLDVFTQNNISITAMAASMQNSEIFNPKFAANYESEDIEGVFAKDFGPKTTDTDILKLRDVFTNAQDMIFSSSDSIMKFVRNQLKTQKAATQYSKIQLIHAYRYLLKKEQIVRNTSLEKFIKLKSTR